MQKGRVGREEMKNSFARREDYPVHKERGGLTSANCSSVSEKSDDGKEKATRGSWSACCA